MRRTFALACLALAFTGCFSPQDDQAATTPTPSSPPMSTPTPSASTAYDETIDFSQDASGEVVQEDEITFPAGVRTFTFSVDFTSDTPTSSTKDVRIWLVDPSGEMVADCDLGTSAVTSAEGRDCGPSTNNVRDGSYSLRWRGFGNLRAHVVVTAE